MDDLYSTTHTFSTNSKYFIEITARYNFKTEKDHLYKVVASIVLKILDAISIRLFIYKFLNLPEHKSWQGRRVLPRTLTEEGPPPHRFL